MIVSRLTAFPVKLAHGLLLSEALVSEQSEHACAPKRSMSPPSLTKSVSSRRTAGAENTSRRCVFV